MNRRLVVDRLGVFAIRSLLVVLIATVVNAGVAQAQNSPTRQHLAGTMFGLGSASNTILYQWEMDRDDVGGRWASRYRTPAGQVAVEDEVVWNRGQFLRYSYVRRTINESSSVEYRSGKLIFTRVLDGQKDQAEEDFESNFTVGPTVIPYAQRHWAELVGGKSLDIRYGVLDRLETYGFELRRDPAHPRNGPNSVVIRMRPTSPFIRMFVDPVYMVLSSDGQTLQQLIGRMLPVTTEEGRLRPVEGQLFVLSISQQKGPVNP